MNKKKVLSVIVTLGLVLSISNTTFATSLNTLLNQKAAQQQQINADKSDLSKSENESQSLSTKIEMMDSQIEAQMRTLEDNKKQVESIQSQISSTEKDIAKAEIEINAEQVLFDKRMRVMYINGTGGYVDILLDSKNFGDFYLRVETIKKVVEYDTKIINDLKDKREVINNKKIILVKKSSELLALKADNENKLSKLNETRKSQSIIIAQYKSKQNLINAKIKTANLDLASITKQINSYSRGSSIASTTRNSNVGSVAYTGSDALVAYAFKFMGTPYVWGGTTPNGFDCSGFTQYVYAHFGVGIDRVSEAQVRNGSNVSRDQLQPGDLVFFGSASEPHHVGMYIGNDEYIHAPKTGDVIKVSSLSGRSDFAAARRVR